MEYVSCYVLECVVVFKDIWLIESMLVIVVGKIFKLVLCLDVICWVLEEESWRIVEDICVEVVVDECYG